MKETDEDAVNDSLWLSKECEVTGTLDAWSKKHSKAKPKPKIIKMDSKKSEAPSIKEPEKVEIQKSMTNRGIK